MTIENYLVNNSTFNVVCGYYTEIVAFDEGNIIEVLGAGLTITNVDSAEAAADGNGLVLESSESINLEDLFTDVMFRFSIQIVFNGVVADGDVITMDNGSEDLTFTKSDQELTSGGSTFFPDLMTAKDYVLSMSMIDINLPDSGQRDRFVDF